MSLRQISFFILLFLSAQAVVAQDYKFVVRFTDKNNNGFSITTPGSFLSEKSLSRRNRQNIQVDSTDLPLSQSYVDSISAIPLLHVLNRSRWFNQILVSYPDSNLPIKIHQFSFVSTTEPVNNSYRKKTTGLVSVEKFFTPGSQHSAAALTKTKTNLSDVYNYGVSRPQVTIHHGEYLHNHGYHGEGMTIAILDDGFNSYLTNPAFDSIRNTGRILGTYDYVNQKVSVNEEDGHGANCFSIIAANIPGTMVGTAPGAKYWLFKTEDINSETPVEEQNWIAAAEYADSAGVDLITTSLGYDYFDDSTFNLNYAQRNGHYSPITIAANLAVAKGIIVTASAGNDGEQITEKKYIICPADGDSVFAVGATDTAGLVATFSCWGPNASGQVKPDGVSVGKGTVFIGPEGNAFSGNGTSYSNPNLAGLIICLWQAFPEFNVHDLLAAVRQSGNHYSNPDDRYGYGIPDFEKAYQILLVKRNPGLNITAGEFGIRVYPIPFNNVIHIIFQPTITGTATLQLISLNGSVIQKTTIPVTANQLQFFDLHIPNALSEGSYFIRYQDQVESKTIKLLKN